MRNTKIQNSVGRFISVVATLAALSFFSSVVYAQIPDFIWAKRAGGTDWDEGFGIATDDLGNSIVTGWFEGTATFGTITLTSAGWLDMFIAKYDASGNVLWAKQAGGTDSDLGHGIATDGSGNSVVTGYFKGTATFGTITLTSAGSADIFIAKYDASGNVLWAKRAGGTDWDYGYGIATDGSGNSLVIGYFNDTATFDPITLTSAGWHDIFIAKYDASGNVLWAKQAGGTDSDLGHGIATDGAGNSIVTGDFYSGTATFGPITLTSTGSYDIFIAKYDASGNVLWAKRAGGTYYDAGLDISTDGSGNSVVTGWFSGTATFGPVTLTSAGTYDIFIAKYDASGNVLWARWAGGTDVEVGYGIATDGSGNSIVTGFFNDMATFGPITLTSAGDEDIFIAKYNASGDVLWAKRAGGTDGDEGFGIATDGSGNSLVTGYFRDTVTFGSIPLTSAGDEDIFIAKLGGDVGGVHVVIPDTTGQPNTWINIPINVITDVTGMGIISAEIDLSWDHPAVLDNASATTGSIIPSGWLFNSSSPPGSGQMIIRMAGTETIPPTDPLAGTGSLVMLTFEVVGQHLDSTLIHFDKMVFNEGDPLAITHDGLFKVFAGWDITGNIYYCLNNEPVDDAIVPAVGTAYKDTTDVNGDYELLDLLTGNYVVRPKKWYDLGDPPAISAFDAAWILQYGVGLRTFEPCQMIASDVSGNGSVSAFDAAKILQYGVGLINQFPVMPDSIHFWRFVSDDFALTMSNWMNAPDSIAYTPLNSNVVDDYKAIVYGDVSGNWQPTDGGLARSIAANVDIWLDDVYGKAGDKISLPINLDNASDIIAMNFTLEYDPRVLKAVGASLTSLTQDYLIAHDEKNGQIRVGLAGSHPIVGSGAIVNLEFEVLETESPDAGSVLDITEMVINDGSIAANIEAARFQMGSPVPAEYALHQNYPNPFNPETTIKYQLPKSGKVVLKIYNSLGQEIRTLINEEKEAGYHEVSWDGRDNNGINVSAGVYIYRIQVGDFVSIKKMLFLR